MTLDDEIREQISLLPEKPEVVDDWEDIADELSDSFYWVGSKIDWSKTDAHKTLKLHGDYSVWLDEIKKFIHDCNINDALLHSDDIFYINDSSLDFSIKLNFEQFCSFLNIAIRSIPQHHYFFEKKNKWCLVISSEGYVDFGFSTVDKK
ncbi:type IV secretion protein Rhs [Lonsdalea quercina]|uniref:type IV secretion protein Rhs n=1 Tax=Lonsdalea quercina TaxID=71657 RepID=UPI0039768C00